MHRSLIVVQAQALHSGTSNQISSVSQSKIVQGRLGHSTIAITLDTYSHVSPGLQEAAAERFDDAFEVSHNKTVKQRV